jgi:hypothetical protein
MPRTEEFRRQFNIKMAAVARFPLYAFPTYVTIRREANPVKSAPSTVSYNVDNNNFIIAALTTSQICNENDESAQLITCNIINGVD